MTLALVGISMPNFWLGRSFAILSRSNSAGFSRGYRDAGAPGAARGDPRAALSAILARMTRASLLEELRELYVLAARARGLSHTRAVSTYASNS